MILSMSAPHYSTPDANGCVECEDCGEDFRHDEEVRDTEYRYGATLCPTCERKAIDLLEGPQTAAERDGNA